MKRGLLFVLVLACGAVLGAALYTAARPERTEDERKIDWLARELGLSAAQRAKVGALHEEYCPEICRLDAAREAGSAAARGACRETTRRLIDAVSAELTPAQRARYRELVARCLREGGSAAHP